MTVIELPDDQAALLKAKAAAQGLGLVAWLGWLAREETKQHSSPKKSAYGLLAKYGPGPSAEEIDDNRREMLRGFADYSE
ncbi:MAG: hypothetical protein JST93_34190 [Acidobacteria bacterium]|nr:hypothetical protein [Acidobacteriota bacterium]